MTRTLTSREPAGLTSRYSQNAGAYEVYLRGRYHWKKRTPEDFRRAVNEFSQVIEMDPTYAPAYAGLADSYTLMGYFYNLIPFDEARVRARAAATKALELDQSLAEAHMSMAGVLEFEQWDWAGAEQEYRRAIQLTPNYASAYHWYANNLSIRGRHDEAIEQGTRAVELDPLSPIVHVALGHAYYLAGRHDEAIEQLQKSTRDRAVVCECSPVSWTGLRQKGVALGSGGGVPQGRCSRALGVEICAGAAVHAHGPT